MPPAPLRRRFAARHQKIRPMPRPNKMTAPAATKNHLWLETRLDIAANQPSSAVGFKEEEGEGSAELGSAVSSCASEGLPSPKAGLFASPSAVPWSSGKLAVGLVWILEVVVGLVVGLGLLFDELPSELTGGSSDSSNDT